MNASELVSRVEEIGGVLMLEGDRIRYELPEDAASLLEVLRLQREEVKEILRQRREQNRIAASLPACVRVVAWEPKQPPVAISRCSVATEVFLFIETTLTQLRHALAGDNPWLAGNWSVRDLLERLEQVGVKLELEGAGEPCDRQS